MLTMRSTIGDVYAHPLGQDIVNKLLLQLNKPQWFVNNVLIKSLRLSFVKKLVQDKVGDGFFDMLLTLLNSEQDKPKDNKVYGGELIWWKEAVFYQVYPKSFTTDGLNGILSKLDILKQLGVDAVWLSPVYDSPFDDNGYDIRNYYDINPMFGTMADMDALIEGLHGRGMKLIMDLVVNHTSDEHAWFQDALNNPNSKYRDYYHFKKSPQDVPPNNWKSFFGGSAWNYYPEQDIWALHLFSKKQMDLNWENESMRKDIHEMVRWWLDKGVDGFRLDVINYISKTPGLPDGNAFIGDLMTYTGIEQYFYGPRLHEFLQELHCEAFMPYNAFSVGETPGIGMMGGRLLTDDYRGELDLIFSFDHLENPGKSRFDNYKYDLRSLKKFYLRTLNADNGHGWHTLFFNNHDNPRMVSKIDPSGVYHEIIAKMLIMLQCTLRGTPFVYQGDELGAVNEKFTSIDQISDVESLGLYEDFIQEGKTPNEAFQKIISGTRDHARVPIDWKETERQMANPGSIWRFYQDLIAWRKENPIMVYGDLQFIDSREYAVFRYRRVLEGREIYIEVNLTERIARTRADYGMTCIFGNYSDTTSEILNPYEARIYMNT